MPFQLDAVATMNDPVLLLATALMQPLPNFEKRKFFVEVGLLQFHLLALVLPHHLLSWVVVTGSV